MSLDRGHGRVETEPDTTGRVYLPPVTIDDHINRDHHLLLWQVRGVSDFVLDGQPCTLQVGHALWVPSGVVHGFTTRMNSVLLPVVFPVATTATVLHEPAVIPVDRDLRTLFLAYIQTTYSIIRPNIDIARQIFALIEGTPAALADLPMPSAEPALSVAEALRFNPGDPRGVKELAFSAHTSARTIERAFLAETGMTLRQWRIKNRMEVAGVLLRSTTTIDAVAHRVGYTSTSAFRRVFKQHFGIPPKEYADRYTAQ